MTKKFIAFFILLTSMLFGMAQTTVKGFVYDASSGEPVGYCPVLLQGTSYGAMTEANGNFIIDKVPKGHYVLTINFFGYDTFTDTIEATGKMIIKRYMINPSKVSLDEIQVTGETDRKVQETRTAVISISPKEISKMPAIGGQPDFAQYLQVIPGVVFTGDQGGQLYIRGGSPIQNKVLLDGMIVYNPFHSIGLFSVFDTDIIRNAEVYTGGFGAEYGGRVSSVMDITTRDGNKKRISGKVGASTFGAKLMVEGPLKKAKTENDMSVSFILSAKNSYLEQTSQTIYSGILDGEVLPYNFQDIYGKVSLNAPNGSKINFFGFNFNDQVNNYKSISDFSWVSYGGGSNFVLIPGKSPVLIEGNVAYSKYDARLSEMNNPGRSSSIDGFNAGFTFSYFLGKNTLKYGVELLGFKTVFDYTKSNGIKLNQTENTTELGAFIKYKWQLDKLIIEPSMRIQWYASLAEVSPEPRIALKYNVTDWFRLKAAAGMYSQNLIAANSDRDVVNLFYGFLSGQDNIPKKFNGKDVNTKLQKANHYIVGTEFDVLDNLTLNIEGYFKDFRQLTNMNRNQIYSETNHPAGVSEIEWRDFMVENGKAYGIDFSLKYEYMRWYVWAAYSLAYVNKNYETANHEIINYRTHYDRRHNINFIVTYTGGTRKQWEFSGRWNIGSGFPFTQVSGFYEQYQFDDMGMSIIADNGELGIIYGELNRGELPWYHRLDLDLKRKFWFTDNIILEADFSVTNVYNRDNIFYVDIITSENIYQLPIMPSLGLTLSF